MKICNKCGVSKNIEEFYPKRSDCKECNNRISREYKKKNKEKVRQYNAIYKKDNYEKVYEQRKQWAIKNKETYNEQRRAYCKKKYYEDSIHRLKVLYRTRILDALKLKGINKKSKSTREMLGCSYDKFKSYLESKFTDGMSWENQGKWHIDHIIPLSSAKTKKELEKLFHYSNCQPLWAEDNLKKSNKILSPK